MFSGPGAVRKPSEASRQHGADERKRIVPRDSVLHLARERPPQPLFRNRHGAIEGRRAGQVRATTGHFDFEASKPTRISDSCLIVWQAFLEFKILPA